MAHRRPSLSSTPASTNIQNELHAELGRRGLLPNAERFQLEGEGTHPELRLSNGLRVIISQMRKQPSLHNP